MDKKTNIGNAKHKLCKHPLYGVYHNIISRTRNKNNPFYHSYGGRGILMCEEWKNSFKSFFDWAMRNGYKHGLSIDRINNDGDYEPSNCRVTTKSVQARNTRLLNSNNSSGFRGVMFVKAKKRWVARIRVNRVLKHLGYFNTPIEASNRYDKYVVDNSLEHPLNKAYDKGVT